MGECRCTIEPSVVFREPVETRVFDTVRCVLFSSWLRGMAAPPAAAAVPTAPLLPLAPAIVVGLLLVSARVFFT